MKTTKGKQTKQQKKVKTLSPRDAKLIDIASWGDIKLIVRASAVVVVEEASDSPEDVKIIRIPKSVFNAMVDWYNKPQKVTQ